MLLKKWFLIFVMLVFVFPQILTAGEMVEINQRLKGYWVKPEYSKGKNAPALLLLHEWWGLTDSTKQIADRLASNGYAVLALDLYRGKTAKSAAHAHELMNSLDLNQTINDMRSGISYLKEVAPYLAHYMPLRFAQSPGVDGRKIGVLGWGMGGNLALQFAVEDERINALVVYDAKLPQNPDFIKQIKPPLFGVFSGVHPINTPKQVEEFQYQCEHLGKSQEINSYENAVHGFASPGQTAYSSQDADDAWEKMAIFLKANL